MKRHINKLGVLMIITAMVPFIMAAMASADHHERRTIHGKYAFTGSNACMAAFFGFDSDLQPNPIPSEAPPGTPASAPFDAQTWEGVYKFKHNGTGAIDVLAHEVGLAGGGGSVSIHWDFNYTVDPGGKITFTLVPGSYVGKWLTGIMARVAPDVFHDISDSWHGVISPDGNHILVTWGAPLRLPMLDSQGGNRTGAELICNGSFVLFRQR
jgi:hypothetical protein